MTTKTASFLSLDDILTRDTKDLAKLPQGEFFVTKLQGKVPWTTVDQPEYKAAKKGCFKLKPTKKGQKPEMDFDDDKLKIRLIIEVVDKDPRSDFTFASKPLLEKLGVTTAEQAVERLVSPGEIHNWAMEIQETAGFSDEAQEEAAEDIKN
ncbi:phage tail assembly chaperone [Paenibacillus agilis]|uniref:Uncharacterized protein n=1 Tax=Paenibacillus agilis TaxID=3020863 RepID=A0A559IX64_9BACL|nr:hypothetical protein [Paenibacillus agilis]TVX92224.1 hypothetical protein FPZ44_03615 [Paenibacillus agilis]